MKILTCFIWVYLNIIHSMTNANCVTAVERDKLSCKHSLTYNKSCTCMDKYANIHTSMHPHNTHINRLGPSCLFIDIFTCEIDLNNNKLSWFIWTVVSSRMRRYMRVRMRIWLFVKLVTYVINWEHWLIWLNLLITIFLFSLSSYI